MKDISDGAWLAVDDMDEEGVWKDSINKQPLNDTQLWADGEPNGRTAENCGSITNCLWFVAVCIRTFPCLCESKPRPNLKLRGLCKETLIDRDFQPQNDVNNIERLIIVGHSTSIEYDQKVMLWQMDVVFSNVTGTSIASQKSYTLGKNTWKIIGDKGCKKESNTYTPAQDVRLQGG